MTRLSTLCNCRKQVLSVLFALASFTISFAQNPIVTENQLAGNPFSEWGLPDELNVFKDNRIAGFATQMSVNSGETVFFQIGVESGADFTMKIYRIGYYNGMGGRQVADLGTITGAPFDQNQDDCAYDPATGLLDCSNWNDSVSWAVPLSAVSGMYIAKLERTGGGANHIVFIVRNDVPNLASGSDILLQLPDATWQAYNRYGGNNFYDGGVAGYPAGHAVKLSYNRPFFTETAGFNVGIKISDWYMNCEYPMIRWLERNGYNVTYTTNVDAATRPAQLLYHKLFISLGHDEYWSKEQRDNVTAARNAGVHLAFFSGNEVYWKTRWEDNNRTLVCYKEGFLAGGSTDERVCGYKCDPTSTWTGLWRIGSGAYGTPPGGDNYAGNPENELTGQISWHETSDAIEVPATYKKIRFWRNTSIPNLATGQTATLAPKSLGYEWNWEQYPDSYPRNRITMSSTTIAGKTHKLSLYRHSSGALVFGAGTVQWSWGLDNEHFDNGASAVSQDMQQATVNLFADMDVQPGSLQANLTPAAKSTDIVPPVSSILSPANGSPISPGTSVVVTGNATDAGGVVAGVEVSTDGGATWHVADISAIDGNITWSYSFTAGANASYNIKSKGFDDSGNAENPGPGITLGSCPCNIFQPADVPANPLNNDGQPIEVGIKFRSTQDGYITGLRYYKGANSTGTRIGHLWSSNGTMLAEVTFINETASGWQEISLAAPVAITSGITYIVSYFSSSGDFAKTNPYFTQAVINGRLRALASGEDGGNGLYIYSATPAFPVNNFQTPNYWADVIFNTNPGTDITPPTVTSVSPLNAAADVIVTTTVQANFSETMDASSVTNVTFELRDAGNNLVPATVSTANNQITLVPTFYLNYSSTYTGIIKGGTSGVKDLAGNPLASDYSWTFTTVSNPALRFTVFQPTDVPAVPLANDAQAIEVGTRFRSVQNGYITGFRYYKGSGATGTRTGHLWNNTGTMLAEAVFVNEGTSGWQEVSLATPVAITAGATYVVSYHSSSGDYAKTNPFFTQTIENGPLRGLANGVDGPNGVYIFSATPAFPINNFETTNYWADVVFNTSIPDITPPTIISVSPANDSTDVGLGTSVIANFSEALDASTVTTTTFQLKDAGNNIIPAAVSKISGQITLTPTSPLDSATVYTATITGGASGVKDLAGNPLASDSSWSFTTVAPDVTPPTVLSVMPANGATGVNVGTTVAANFSEAVDVSTVTVSTFQLKDTSNNIVAATVSASSGQITLTPTSSLAVGAVYTATITGGSSGVKDLAGNAMANDYSWSFTTSSTFTIFQPTDVPAVPFNNALKKAIEVGVKFRSAQNGYILGLRFYKGAGTTGTHTGHLWSNTGTMLAEATFVNESASGWQQVLFPAPVAITAGTTYVASYLSSSGGFAYTISFFTQAVVNGPLRGLANGEDGANGVYKYSATAAFPTSSNQATNYWADVVFVTSISADLTPPTVSSVTPLNGAAGVSVGTIVTANFNEAVGAATVTTTTFRLRDAGNNIVPATVSTASDQITLTPLSPLTFGTVYTATITGGASGVKDLAGNPLANDYVWSFTTVAANEAFTIFQPTAVPAVPSNTGNNAVEVGVKFRSAQNGFILGIRYYKGAGITGTHIGHLWSRTGTMLAEATFVNESASGWQQVLFATPVAITADTTYVASYLSSSGRFSYTISFFTQAVVNGPLRALANGEVGANGVYKYSATAAFPTSSNQATNYWADVIFSTSASTDLTPPTVLSVTPVNGAAGVNVGTIATANFSEAVDAATVTTTTFRLRDAGNNIVPASVSTASGQITLTPTSPLTSGTVYTATITGGASGVKDLADNPLASDYIWSFTTVATNETFTIFQPTAVPAVPSNTGNNAVEVGVKFRSAQNGFILGIRYYKGAGITGTHIGHLWSRTGTMLAEATFVNESASGWQQVLFATPVAITADTTYVASYLSSSGRFSYTISFFTQAVVNGPLRALANGEVGANGVYKYSATAAFPTSSNQATNYWADVVFSTSANPDLTPPTVSSVTPVNNATGVSVGTTVIANFSEAVNASTVTTSTFQLKDAGDNIIAAAVSTSSGQITLTPSSPLDSATVYTATIIGGASGVKDLPGNALLSTYSWSFTTETVASQSQVSIFSIDTKTSSTSATIHSLTGVPAGALLVLTTTMNTNNPPSNCIVSSSPSLTWTKRADAGATNSNNAEIWTAVYSAGGAISVTSNWGTASQASVCYIVLNAESTLGGASGTGVSQAAPSVTLTTTRANSIIFGCTADWNAVNGSTRTLRDSATERLYFNDINYTTYFYTKAAGAIGAYTEGVSLPTGQQASTALLEIRGTTAGATDVTPPTVTSVTPLNGATGVGIITTVSAIFSEAMNAGTINGTTIELRNPASALITATVSYNAGTNTVTLTPSAALANSTVYTATIKSGASGVKDVAGNPLASDQIWSFTTAAADVTPPTVTSVTPLNGATSVSTSTAVSAIFSEAMNAGTINGTTIELRNPASALITATVSYNAGTNTATLTPSAALANSTVYTATIKGGASGVKDVAGNPLASDHIWSFTTTAAASVTYNIFSPTSSGPNQGAPAREVGVKFRVTQAGNITGIRFYKTTANTGTHTGNLWSNTGTNLASVTFTGETASGWQQALFASPVAVTPGVTYIASYFTPTGNHAITTNFFTAAVVNGPLRALASSEGGGNGVFINSAVSTFPNTSSGLLSNFWVDVVFTTDISARLMTQQSSRQETLVQKLVVKITPNPSSGFFNLIAISDDKAPVSVRISDISGRVLEYYEKITAGSLLQAGQSLKAGAYFAEIIQGDQRKVMKIIKIN